MSATPRTDALAASDAPHHEWVETCRELEADSVRLRAVMQEVSRYFIARNLGEPANQLNDKICAALEWKDEAVGASSISA